MALRLQVASDVQRDGLGVELVDEHNAVIAEVFRNDATHRVTVSCFAAEVPLMEMERMLAFARERLGRFEDGTPLPERLLSTPE